MRYRRLGRWGVKVSEVTLGTWLTHGGAADVTSAIAHTRRAYDLGINMFDTANVYPEGSEGAAERILGEALSVLPRDTYLVATKVFSPMGDGPLQRGLSRKHIMAQVHASLSRLGLDHIDLYQCHRYDSETPLEETAETMNDLIRQGKITYWGVSEWSVKQVKRTIDLCRAQGWALPVSNQLHYSALWREHQAELLTRCRELGMGVLAFAPLAHGVLSGKYRHGASRPAGSRGARTSDRWMLDRYFDPRLLHAVGEVRRLAEAAGCTCSQIALAWCLKHPAVSSVVVGVSSSAQLDENIAASGLDIDGELMDSVDKILGDVKLT